MPAYRIPIASINGEPTDFRISTADLGNGQWEAWIPSPYTGSKTAVCRGKTEGEAVLALIRDEDE